MTPVYRALHVCVWLGARLLHRVRIEGRGHLPRSGGYLLAAKHQSFIDIPLIAAVVPGHVCFVARDTLARSRVLGFIIRSCGAVLVRRNTSDRRALREIAAHLARGDRVAMFPEGTRTPDGRVKAFRGGALLAARMAGAPVVPTAIRGAFDALPRQRRILRPARVSVTFGAPLDPRAPDALERLQAAVEAMVGDGRIG
jgi:1-acyl-sn-glycerol-3-phosphate acyltransferase